MNEYRVQYAFFRRTDSGDIYAVRSRSDQVFRAAKGRRLALKTILISPSE
jgi:hypothetical protein